MFNTFCDALIQLGPNFDILQPSPRFAAMMLCTRGETLQGADFRDFLASDQDRGTVARSMETYTPNLESGAMVPVHMRDANGCVFRAAVYHTCFVCRGGERRFL